MLSATHPDGRQILRFELPIRTLSEANSRQHWAAKAKRVSAHKNAARLVTGQALRALGLRALPPGPVTITLTRKSIRRMDSDNLAGACKAARDGIAEALGVDDGDPRITWAYAQRVDGKMDPTRAFGLLVEMRWGADGT